MPYDRHITLSFQTQNSQLERLTTYACPHGMAFPQNSRLGNQLNASAPTSNSIPPSGPDPSYLFLCCHDCLSASMIKPFKALPPFSSKKGAFIAFTTCRICVLSSLDSINSDREIPLSDRIETLIQKHSSAFDTLLASRQLLCGTEVFRAACKISKTTVTVIGRGHYGNESGTRYISILEVLGKMMGDHRGYGIDIRGMVWKNTEELVLNYLPAGFL